MRNYEVGDLVEIIEERMLGPRVYFEKSLGRTYEVIRFITDTLDGRERVQAVCVDDPEFRVGYYSDRFTKVEGTGLPV